MTNATIQAQATHDTTQDTYFAQPLSGAQGFYFSTLDNYQRRAELLRACGVEEFELQYIDGDHAELWAAAGVSQAGVGEWFELLDTLDEWQEPALFYLMDTCGESISDALQHVEDVSVCEGSPEDYAIDLMDDTGALNDLTESLRYYFSFSDLARDMLLNGEITEVRYNGTDYIMSGY